MAWCRLSIPTADTRALDGMALEALSRGLPVRIIARGQSMRPAIRDGDRLVLVGDTRSVQLGDVVVLPDRPFAVCHRVVARVGERVWVKGDAVGTVDGRYMRGALTARVVAVERGALHQPARRIGAVVGSMLLAGPRRVRNRS